LQKVTVFPGSVPHEDLIALYGSSSLLLLILTGYKDAEGFLPGKLFEYFATGLPVMGVGPTDGDAAALIKETGAGVMVESKDEAGIRKALDDAYRGWQRDEKPHINFSGVQAFSRKQITAQLADILSLR